MDVYILVSLGLCLLTLGVFGYLMSVRFAEQNTKISAMVDLINTVVQDVQMIKISNTTDKLTSDLGLFRETQQQHAIEQSLHSDLIGSCSFKQIVVSDADTNTDDDDVDDTDDEHEPYKEDYESPNIRSIDIQSVDLKDDDSEGSISEDEVDIEEEDHEQSIHEDKDVRKIIYPQIEEPVERLEKEIVDIQITLTDVLSTDVPSIEPEEFVGSSKSEMDEKIDQVILVDDGKDEKIEEVTEYSKLDVVQLRKLVVEKKLSTAPAKLKKKELISILTLGK
jgi:hypothetical protein